MIARHYKQIAIKYAEDVIYGAEVLGNATDIEIQGTDLVIKGTDIVLTGDDIVIAGDDIVNACKRFLEDLKRDDIEYRSKDPDACITLMEGLFVHRKGEKLDGTPLLGKPLKLEPWEIFIVCNLLGFYYTGTEERRFKEGLIMLARKNGKAVSLDTEIPTPDGWKMMGDIHEGDYVYGHDGKPAKVIVESEIFNKPMYRVTFEDGAEIKASEDHVWTVQTKSSRRTGRYKATSTKKRPRADLVGRDGWFETTTKDISEKYVNVRSDGKGVEYEYRVPMPNAVQYPKRDLPVDPYTLGVWLGDGSSSSTAITCSDGDKHEMMSLLAAEGHKCEWHKSVNRAGAIYLDVQGHAKKNPLRDALREIGVFNNKHIPEMYMTASIDQRLALLQGLMDTDGTCSKAGQCEFVQKSMRISDQIVELISSLGLKATKSAKIAKCNGKDAGIVYRVQFWTDQSFPCFRLERKRIRLKENIAPRMKAKSIVKVERIADEPSKCIAIDNESHLYLVGRQYTATHNTSFVAALSFAVSIMQRRSGSTVYVVAAALKQSMESFKFIDFSLTYKGIRDEFIVKDNAMEHSIQYTFEANGVPDGSIDIQIMASNPDAQDSFNCNFAIADEMAAYKKASQYNRFKEAMKGYTNKLMIGITTAGDNANSFGYRRMEYAAKVAAGTVKDDELFAFIARADVDDKGNCDFTSPIQHRKANPNYGVTIRPKDILNESLQAQNDPQQRKDFLSRSLNIYTTALKAWFDIEEFRASDRKYSWTLEELARMKIDWFGGADLSRVYDLTAAALVGRYEDVDIIITHGFTPIAQAAKKSDEDNIPLFGWEEDGWLTMCNSPTVNIADIVNWFVKMRKMGFRIKAVGHDRKFAGEEYFPAMKKAGFNVIDQPQYFYLKSQGFRHIETAAKNGTLYYLHSTAYEYCVQNVAAVEKTDDAVQYEKVSPEMRIDLFDASVFATIQMVAREEKEKKGKEWWGDE